jgi:para-aminobenzoate synthetase / 4-amino-4-deoxychorismate lyase
MDGVLPTTPFVLLDDARISGASPARLYTQAEVIITASTADEVRNALSQLGKEAGHWAGYISYEAGYALEPRLAGIADSKSNTSMPMLWFARFAQMQEIPAEDVGAILPPVVGGWASAPIPNISRAEYGTAFSQIQAFIEAGDIYQANLTFQNQVAVAGHPLAVYAGLRARSKAGYGAVVWTGTDWLLSLSPELFFALQNGKITTKPMKGTMPRHHDHAADEEAKGQLLSDPKQRAENLMIVDLLRNDLSRVAKAGSVDVPHLFTIETYPSVHTMTSTVTAELTDGVSVADILSHIYPCGSITGAPKIRAMEIINAIEGEARGIYTGSIGRIDPNGDAAFNVAIRTLHWKDGDHRATLGLGSGIVADSRLGEEWSECLTKGRFVADERRFDLIETMRFEPQTGIALLERHIARISMSAQQLNFRFDRHAARNELQAATFRLTASHKIRLLLSRCGAMAIEIGSLPKASDTPLSVAIANLPVAQHDFRLRHKTTDRAFYDDARRSSSAAEVLFLDKEGHLTEGSFSNIFVPHASGYLTPKLSLGLLPGILRQELIESGQAKEALLTPADLSHGFFIGNACRGLVPARII